VKIKVQHKALLELLAKADLARAKRALLPICTNFLVESGNGGVSVTGGDLDIYVTATGKAEVQRKGAIVVSYELYPFLKTLKGETVSLEAKAKEVIIKVDSLTASFEAFEREDYPPLRPPEGPRVKVKGLAEVLANVAFCAATEDMRPVLNGVCFSPQENGGIDLAAADGFRLGIAPLRATPKLDEGFILPLKAAMVAIKLFKGQAELRVVKRNEQQKDAYIEENGTTLRAATISGNYPNYRRLVPKAGKVVKFNTQELAKAVNAIASAIGKSKPAIVRLQVGRGAIKVSYTGEEKRAECQAPTPSKGTARIAFDCKYLKEVLARLGTDASITVSGPQDPAVFRSRPSKTTYVLMPMFVQW
jgi:DNA polymerase-3 subunit beta